MPQPGACSGSSTTAPRTAARRRSSGSRAHPNLRLIHLPIHASWLNQIEIYFSIVQRKVLTPNDFADLDAVEHRLLAFQHRYEQLALPFEWKFTRADLRRLMARLERPSLLGAAA